MQKITTLNLLNELDNLLKSIIQKPLIVSPESNNHILYAFTAEINSNIFSISNIKELIPVVKANLDKTFLNSQPIIFFIYSMILNNKSTLLNKWPLSKEELKPYFTQLGVSTNNLF